MVSGGSAPPRRPRRVNQELLDQMVSLRRDGFTMKAIAEKVGVSERTVRRYVRGVEPDIRMPSELDSNELTDGFYDQVLASRRRIVAIASEDWAEPVELGMEAVDSAMKSLRELLAGMEIVSIRKLGADESLRDEFFREFMTHVLGDWIRKLKTEHLFRELDWPSGDYEECPDDGDLGPGV